MSHKASDINSWYDSYDFTAFDSMKKILILTPFYSPNIGGAETFTKGVVDALKKEVNVTVVTFKSFSGEGKCIEEESNLKIYRFNWPWKMAKSWKGLSLSNFLSVFPKLFIHTFSVVNKNKFDFVEAHGIISGLIAVLLKKIFKFKVHLTLLALYDFEDKSKFFRSMTKFVFDRCDVIFVEGEWGRKDIEVLGSKTRSVLFYHWCDQEVFKPIKKDENQVTVLFIGRPIPEKGKHIILSAEKLLNNDKYKFIYVENATHEELTKLYQMAHIVVVPSLYSEGYSRVVIESASCGCAVITSDRGSLPEQVRGWGRSVEAKPESFAKAIQETTSEWNFKAYQYAKENFSSKNAEVFLNVYKDG